MTRALITLNTKGGNMKRPAKGGPNLDDALSEGFSEMKIGEENIVTVPTFEPDESEESLVSKPIEYGKKIQTKEDRESFVVTAPLTETATKAEESPDIKPEILKTPTSQLGDDFDVEW